MKSALASRLPELIELERLIKDLGPQARVNLVGNSIHRGQTFPLYTICMGSTDPKAPTLGLFGGVHGLERIGTQVNLSFLRTVCELTRWDAGIAALLEKSRMVFFPLVNPGGMYALSRSNPHGVDLMRNAPVDADPMSRFALFGGHRISPRLPWYRGPVGAPMEIEANALCELVRKEILPARVSISLDVHSGFGARDRVWFPYARTRTPFPNIAEMLALKQLLDRTYPNHIYIVEPQSRQYLAHGDLWDFLYDEQRQAHKENFFLPLTLEMGSWVWAKKDLRQIFSVLGAFNPMKPHRLQRTLRRHLLFLDFLHRAVVSPDAWLALGRSSRESLAAKAEELWYVP